MAFKKEITKKSQLTVRMYKEDYNDLNEVAHSKRTTMANIAYTLILKEIEKYKKKEKND